MAANYQGWKRYSRRAYVSDTHGGRFVQNYGNSAAREYGKYERLGRMATGAVLAKDSFEVRGGRVVAGPLFVMEKMASGFNADSGNWRYTLVMPNGKVIGVTNGKGSKNVAFCIGCHSTAEDTDSLFLLPDEYRIAF
ncbi:MAG: cytochrome P460 family protein [Alphaproteobacteria bacterium]